MATQSVDRMGTVATAACGVHCLLTALVPGAIATLGLDAVFGHEAEWGFTLAAVLLATLALVLGWPKHRSRWIAATLLAGIGGLLLARVVEESGGHATGTVLGVLAGLALVTGHVSGTRSASRRTNRCTPRVTGRATDAESWSGTLRGEREPTGP